MKHAARTSAAESRYEGGMFLRNFGLLSPVCNVVITQRTKLFIIKGVKVK
jgi:hypothetical protein